MKNYIPTYDEAKAMVVAKGELVFYETERFIDGYKVSTFNYRLAQFTDFIKPLTGRKNADAKELRGLCFVFNKDGSLYKRFLMLKKFWNVNQVTETLYENIKDLTIKSIYTKEDGSLISFIKFPNGRVIPKTKMGFDNDQTKETQKIYDTDENIQNFVKWCLDNDMVSMWEYVSWQNKIVLNYNEPELILLKVRNNTTGEYIDIEDFRDRGIKIVEGEKVDNLDDLMKKAETDKDKEGWVIQFDNDYLVKQKTAWYFLKHRMLDNLSQENIIIEMILNETIDDVLSQLDEERDSEQIEWVENIENKIKTFINKKQEDVEKLLKKYNKDIREFAIKNNKDINFGIAIQVIRGGDLYDSIKNYIKKQTHKLEKARIFLRNI